ncbi:unnamed protein product [Malassezia sympodialis ATCC 42132]|uniref:uncharacterized protein n=1 Tax=Malassezia sympodialis (strain ATCC 42132) TaxID=1230383 RepID=UPI0002C1B0A4|nr:uncharacterized protein MSY001_1067 [Malassezia sympodialis ATCC 42132]CCU98361.1 unnamed protein product [Malassezia sympodialis ATCC 42132]|eukprot:XP_018739671.1 uncharacterized protein MSY001_1067 [Malassezia sympodialis ATCC 42132]
MRLYQNGSKTEYPMHTKRTKELFLAFLREQGVLHLIENVNAASLDQALTRQKYSVLYFMPGSESERIMIENVRMSVSSPMAFFASDDPAVAQRLLGGGPGLFVLQGGVSNLVASLPLSVVAGQSKETAVPAIAQWLNLQAQPPVVELSASGLDSALLQAPGIVMAVLSSSTEDLNDQLKQFTEFSHAWRSSSDLSHKPFLFAWLDYDRLPPKEPGLKRRSFFYGLTAVRVTSTPLVTSHPLLMILVFLSLLLLIPRMRRMLLRWVPRSHASTKMV